MSSIPEYLNRTPVPRTAYAATCRVEQPSRANRHLHSGGTRVALWLALALCECQPNGMSPLEWAVCSGHRRSVRTVPYAGTTM